MRRIAILAALPRELKPLVRGWKKLPAPPHVSLWIHRDGDGDEIVAACAGMGANAVRRAFAAVEALGELHIVLSVGLAGATGLGPSVGSVCLVSEIVDAQTGERFTLNSGGPTLRLATVAQPAHTAEKMRLAATYGAALVDMEAATVARLAAMRDVPMGCVKAVSDGLDTPLPELDRFVNSEGQLSVPRFALHLLWHPASWGDVASLARNSQQAASALAAALDTFLQHKDWVHASQTGGRADEASALLSKTARH